MVSTTIASTTAEERELLRKAGFVHVSGLRAGTGQDAYIIGQNARIREAGCHDYNNGTTVVVTLGGEIWLAMSAAVPERAEDFFQTWEDVFTKLCPRGEGAFVPCSNGETIAMRDLMARLVDPDWEPSY